MSALPRDPALTWATRRPERQLLLASLGCMGLGFLLILGAGSGAVAPDPDDLLPLAYYAVCLIAVHLALVAAGSRADQGLLVAAAFLGGLGLLVQTRMGTFDGAQALDPARLVFPAGMLLLTGTTLAFMGGRYRVLGAYPWVWGWLSLALVAALLITGQRFRGAVFGLGLTTPSEALKLTVVLFLAGWLERWGPQLARWHPRFPLPPWRPLWPLVAYWTALCALLLVQRDLGMTAILGVALLVMLTIASRGPGYAIYGVILAVLLGWLLLGVFEHGQGRIHAWLDPFEDPTGDGWQILQGLSGMFAGGLWGQGFGLGRPDYTPIAESDFVYTVIGEELGLIGCTLSVLVYLLLLQRGIAIARGARSPFGRLLAAGGTAVLAAQTFLNVAGVTKLVPLTGLTLPLVSHGGTSLLTTCALLGLLLAVSDDPPERARRQAPRAAALAPRRRAGTPQRADAPAEAPTPPAPSPPKSARRRSRSPRIKPPETGPD